MAPRFRCDFSVRGTALPHFWEHTVGSDYAPMALRADWQQHLRRCHDELGFHYVRFHGLLSDDMGTLIAQDERFLYSFFNADQVFDFLLSIGMKPFVELSFMPRALASGRKTVFRYAGNVTPPNSYRRWEKLINRLVKHWMGRYGRNEVRQWFFEVWNEPNLGAFWTSTQKEYFKLYRSTVRAIKSVDSALQVGGPATAKNEWITEFLDFCKRHNLPVDFISTHHYPNDAFDTAEDDTEKQLARSERSTLRKQAEETRRQARGKPVYYTEWNSSSSSRDPLHDEPYAAAFVLKTVMEAAGLVEGYSFWTFTDIFAENYFPFVPFHGGFGLLNLHGIPKPTYRVFEILHHVGTELLPIQGTHRTVDLWAARDQHGITLLISNHALPGHAIRSEQCHVILLHSEKGSSATIYRIDHVHANPKALWQRMGQPEYPGLPALRRLQRASALRAQRLRCRYDGDQLSLKIMLPPHSVVAVRIQAISAPPWL